MNQAGWYAQPFRADGGITADGLLNQLGRPSLSELTILVRESAQNSWDARLPNEPVVDFRLDLSTVGAGHIGEWRRLFSSGLLVDCDEGGVYRRLAHAGSIRYLSISDRGTRGLAGPTRSDAGPSTRREWPRFVLNSGDREGSGHDGPSGGTFGYGKGALFRSSKVGCVLVYTRFNDEEGQFHSRFIGIAIRKAFWKGTARYTGRHWWGVPENDHCEPLRDAQADSAARSLGIQGFAGKETGTTLVVVDPDLTDPTLPDPDQAEELSIGHAGTYLADAAGWNLWPITLLERSTRMSVTVTANGVEIPVPGPDNDATLAFFADSYRSALGGAGETLSCGRPRKELGRFASQITYGATVTSPAARELGLEGAPHHVCLLRGPELVVRYYSGPERLANGSGYVGVFKVADDLDETFASAEPPSHDNWEHQQLTGREATFVRVARRRLKDHCYALSGAQARRSVRVGQYALGTVAQRLGHLIAGPGGTGTAVLETVTRPGGSQLLPLPASNTSESTQSPVDDWMPSSGNHGQTSRGSVTDSSRPKVRKPTLISDPHFDVVSGRPVVVQKVQLHGPAYAEGFVRVLTGDGGTESEAPVGAPVPSVYGWRMADGEFVAGEVLYHSGGPTTVELVITAVADVIIDINVAGRS